MAGITNDVYGQNMTEQQVNDQLYSIKAGKRKRKWFQRRNQIEQQVGAVNPDEMSDAQYNEHLHQLQAGRKH